MENNLYWSDDSEKKLHEEDEDDEEDSKKSRKGFLVGKVAIEGKENKAAQDEEDRSLADELVAVLKGDKETEKDNQEKAEDNKERLERTDVHPELDSEAPVPHLSEAEIEDVYKAEAARMLDEEDYQETQPHTEAEEASHAFKENLAESGNINDSFEDAIREQAFSVPLRDGEAFTVPLHEPRAAEEASREESESSVTAPLAAAAGVAAGSAASAARSGRLPGAAPSSYEPGYRLTHSETGSAGRAKGIESAALAGAVAGYLVERRRARLQKNSSGEKVKQQLKAEIKQLQENVAEKDRQIRQMASESQPAAKEALKHTARLESTELKEKPSESKATMEIGQVVAAETMHEENSSVPRLGEFVITQTSEFEGVATAKTAEPRPESKKKLPESAKPEPKVDVYRLNHKELMKYAKKIKIEKTSLKKIFENKVIGEKALRRIIDVYLKGGDVKKRLNKEIIERQIDFERDPILRDQGPIESDNNHNGVSADVRENQRILSDDQSKKQSSKLTSIINPLRSSKQPTKARRSWSMADVGVLTLIAVLLIIVVALIIARL